MSWRKRVSIFLGRLLNSRIGSFSTIGIALTLFGAIYIAAAPLMHMSQSEANVSQAIISIILSFILNFKKTWFDRRSIWVVWQILRFAPSKVVTILINKQLFNGGQVLFMYFFGNSIHLGPFALMTDFIFAYLFSTGVVMYINYFLMDKFVFGGRWWWFDLFDMFKSMAIWPIFFFNEYWKVWE